MEIKIIDAEYEGTSGDCISHYKSHFEKNPTLEEFVAWLLTNKSEWGCVREGWITIIEYAGGRIVKSNVDSNQMKKRIRLVRKDGGWSCMDYTIEFI